MAYKKRPHWTTSLPPTRRTFRHEWHQIEYWYLKASYWLEQRGLRGRARRFVDNLRKAVPKADPHEEALLGVESRALIASYDGDLSAEIHYTQKAASMLESFLRRDWLPDMGWPEVRDLLRTVAMLHAEAGDRTRALEVLEHCISVCVEFGVALDQAAFRAEVQSVLDRGG